MPSMAWAVSIARTVISMRTVSDDMSTQSSARLAGTLGVMPYAVDSQATERLGKLSERSI